MSSDYQFSFEYLCSLPAKQTDHPAYVRWFKQQALDFAQAAVEKIQKIYNFETEKDQGEAWGDRFNPEYELRRAIATLAGLEDRLEEVVAFFSTNDEIRPILEETYDEVKKKKTMLMADFKRAKGWFEEGDSLF